MYKSFLSDTQDKTPMTEMELGHGAHKFEERWGIAEAYITNSAGTQSQHRERHYGYGKWRFRELIKEALSATTSCARCIISKCSRNEILDQKCYARCCGESC
jgi:hypothetical protein